MYSMLSKILVTTAQYILRLHTDGGDSLQTWRVLTNALKKISYS
jgi:hypothetical protein